MKNIKEIKAVFDANPQATEVFVTTDEQVFTEAGAASAHQHSINKETKGYDNYITITRKELETQKPNNQANSLPKAENTKAEKPKAENTKAEKPKAEEPQAEEPKAEEPKAEEPKITKKKNN